MALLTQAPPAAQQYTPSAAKPSAPDDLSGRLHRQLIGVLGLALPFMLWVIDGVRTYDAATRWRPQDSISPYYYTGAVDAFVGLLVALATVCAAASRASNAAATIGSSNSTW